MNLFFYISYWFWSYLHGCTRFYYPGLASPGVVFWIRKGKGMAGSLGAIFSYLIMAVSPLVFLKQCKLKAELPEFRNTWEGSLLNSYFKSDGTETQWLGLSISKSEATGWADPPSGNSCNIWALVGSQVLIFSNWLAEELAKAVYSLGII